MNEPVRLDRDRGFHGDRMKNLTMVQIHSVTLVWSYETIVAFAVSGEGWTRSQNIWGAMTGKHINAAVPRGVEPTPYPEFERQLNNLINRIKITEGVN